MNAFDRGFGPMECAGCRRDYAPNLGERQSFGVYAGVWCDTCWPNSGYRDAENDGYYDNGERFDPLDAGEQLDGPDGYALDQ